MSAIRFDHINIHCHDQEAVRDFLIDVVGVTEGVRPPFDFPGYWLYLDGQPVIHLQSTDRSPTTAPEGWVDHIAFGGFDFEQTRERLQTAGYDLHIGGIPGTGIRQIFVKGPEGARVELQCTEIGDG